MGIQGLLPFLKKIHSPTNISQYSGCTVAIDAYCWLHRGAFSCADKLAMGEKTEQYVYYCMKYVNFLLSKNIKPIMVFDGQHLPSKREVEKSRRERREINRKKAAQFLREGKRAEARDCFQKCVDVTPEMALSLMKACRSKGVDCIVAPYEADAQLAYLNKTGIAQIIITEDSDLLLFGCEKVIFKMDFFGNGVMIDSNRLNEVMDMRAGYTFEKFRYMCILSGCDYLPSLPGIGLAKACKVFKTARQPDIRLILKKIPSYLNGKMAVTDEYIEGFIQADNTFLYQLAFDPQKRKLSPLNPYSPDISPEDVKYAGPYFSDKKAYQIALGNWNIYSEEMMSDFNPVYDKHSDKRPQKPWLLSVWDKNYQPMGSMKPPKTIQTPEKRTSLSGKEQVVDVKIFRKLPHKRQREDVNEEVTDKQITDTYEERGEVKRHRIDVKEYPDIGSTDEVNGQEVKGYNDEEGQSSDKTSTPGLWQLIENEEDKENKSDLLVSPSSRRNKFAVSPKSQKKSRFNLNAVVDPPLHTKTEVKSRFFKNQSKLTLTKSLPQLDNICQEEDDEKHICKNMDKEDAMNNSESNESEDLKATDVKSSFFPKSSSVSLSSCNSPSAFSWSKFKFSKLAKKDKEQTSKMNSKFKTVTPSICLKKEKGEALFESSNNKYQEKDNWNVNAESEDSDSELKGFSQTTCSSQTDSMGDNSQCKFNLGPCSVETVDLTDSSQDSDMDGIRLKRFASQNDLPQQSDFHSKIKESLSVSPPSVKTPLRSSSSCRVSGLTRSKGKHSTLTKTTSSLSDKQQNIKNMFAKFAHKQKPTAQIQHSHSEGDLSSTPVSTTTDLRTHINLSRQIFP